MKIRPLKNRVLIEKDIQEKIGILFLPEISQPVPTSGTVLEVGPKCKEVKIGDKVSFPKYDGFNFTIKDKKYFILREDQILLVH